MGQAVRGLGALALGAALVAAPAPANAGAAATSFQVTARTISHHFTDVGPRGPSAGDSFEFAERLFRHGEAVGRDAGKCDIKRAAHQRFDAQCSVAMHFYRRGDLSAQGFVVFRRGSGGRNPSLPITGGTREFEGAVGRFEVVEKRDEPTRYRLHLR